MFKQPDIIHQPVRRKLVHLTGIVFLVPSLVLNGWIALFLYATIVLATWLLVRFVAYGLIGMCLILLLLDKEAAQAAWLTLIIGDGLAGILGQLCGRHPLPWNPKKSIIGTAAFLLGAGASLILFFALSGNVSFPSALARGVMVASIACTVESLTLPLNDNLTVVLVSGAAAYAAVHLIP